MSSETPAPGIGHRLAARREERGLSLEQAAEQTKIRSVYLQALEADRFGDLPGTAYVTGFLRNYARFLEMDGDELVAELIDQGQINSLAPPPLKIGNDEQRFAGKAGTWRWVVLGVFALAALALGIAFVYDLPPFADRDRTGQLSSRMPAAPVDEQPPADRVPAPSPTTPQPDTGQSDTGQ